MRILLLSKYSRRGASSRLRTIQYIPWLAREGVEIVHSPLLGDDYLQKRYQQGSGWSIAILATYWKRVLALLAARRYDLVWIESEIFPWLPADAERLLGALRVPYVVDYDDATFHRYDQHHWRAIRMLLGRKIDSVMRRAALVVAGNEYIAERARKAGARRVEILPTSVDLTRYLAIPDELRKTFTIGWIGTPMTAKYLSTVEPVLNDLIQKHGVRMLTVGGEFPLLQGEQVESRAWSEESEVADIRRFDVGIMPLPDAPWERGKCGYKLIQYMACGKPVVASPIGVNSRIVRHGENGFLANSLDEWREALLTLRDHPELRQQMGNDGRARVEREYSVQVNAPRLLAWLHEAAGRR